ncbi:nuclear transport factor 2 family protein [Actinokineospora soli]
MNTETIERFYAAFGRKDHAAMAACYAPDVVFGDPVFPDLRGPRAAAMWRMLLSGPGEIRVDLLEHSADERSGSAHWKARYDFGGRPVTNDVRAEFRFADGLIVEHRDSFSFYRWSQQALGPVGLLLGWTPLLRASVRRKAAARLAKVD